MADYRIIDADGHVMELDSELREFIGAPYKDLEWHQSYSFWPGLTMDGYPPLAAQKGGWAGGGDGPKAQRLAALPRYKQDRADGALSDSRAYPRRDPGPRLGDLHGAGPTTIGFTINSWR